MEKPKTESKKVHEIIQELQERMKKMEGEPSKKKNDIKRRIGKEFGMSLCVVQKYLRLVFLEEGLFDLVEQGVLCVSTGYELSFLSKEEQKLVIDYRKSSNHSISLRKAILLKNKSKEERISKELLENILSEEVEVSVIRTEDTFENSERVAIQMELALEVQGVLEEWKEIRTCN